LKKECILILGGARSGKSRFAKEVAATLGERVLFVATAEARDEEMKERISAHRRNRPLHWRTLEAPLDVGKSILEQAEAADVVVLDCLTLLVSNVLNRCTGDSVAYERRVNLVQQQLETEIAGLTEAVDTIGASCVVVSNEVGMGLVPSNALGRLYRDLLGNVNQAFAQRAARVYLMLAGLPVQIKP
jgi:adenosylcobinamide kinase/adenosylcobinamide-phosphate guanylyltransferase